MALSKIQFGAQNLQVISVCDENNELWLLANPFAKILEYSNVNKAVRVHVSSQNQCSFEGLKSAHIGLTSFTSSSIQAKSKFINRAGLFELIQASRMPKAQEFRDWVNADLLVKLCDTGEYQIKNDAPVDISEGMNVIHQMTNAGQSASWHAGEMSLINRCLELQNQLEPLKIQIAVYDAKFAAMQSEHQTVVAEIKRNYEHQMSEYKEREYRMQLQMKDMANAANTTMTQFAVNALLAKDNIEENQQMRQTLTNVSGRVVPEMKEQPHKEEYITGYERMVNGKRRIRMCRSQLHEIEQQDKAIQRYRESPENKRPKMCNSKRYAWLRDSEKFLQLKCPNPVMVWLKVRTDQPHMFYGLRYTNKLKTEMEVLDEQELRAKFREDVEMCKRNRNIHSKLIEEFQSLQLVDENDCVEKCLTPSVDAKERINTIVEGIVENMSKELVPTTPQRSHMNAGEMYTAEQVVHTMNNCQNFFVKNVFNIQYFAGSPNKTPAIQ